MGRNKPNRKIWVFVLIVTVAILACLGYVLWNNGMNKPVEITQGPLRTIEPTPRVAAQDPYKGWKTYTSTRDGYRIKYPPKWIAIKETSTDGPYIRNMQFDGGGYPTDYINLRILRDEKLVSGSDLSPKDWYAKLGVTTVQKGPVIFTPDTVVGYTLNGLDAKKAKSVFTELDEDIFLLHNGALYEINMYPYGASKKLTVKKILASFEFI